MTARFARTGLLLLVLAGVCAGCATMARPSALAGQWVDSMKTTPADTAVWVLAPGGEDLAMRIAVRAGPVGPTWSASKARHYGMWFLRGSLADSTNRALCFVARPGREPPSCVRFVLDTQVTVGGSRRRLILENYQGSRTRLDRVLLERQP